VTATPVTVELSGVVPDGNHTKLYGLTGLGVTASLNTGGYQVVPGSHHWMISGNFFKNYLVLPSDADPQTGHVEHHNNDDVHAPSFTFFTTYNANILVICQATVQTPSGNFDVTASRLFTSEKPSSTMSVTTGILRFNPEGTNTPTRIGLYGTANVGSGQHWEASILMPEHFSMADGQGAFVQTVQDRTWVIANPYQDSLYDTQNDLRGLDNDFPYKYFQYPTMIESVSGRKMLSGSSGDSPSTVMYYDSKYYQGEREFNADTWTMFKPEPPQSNLGQPSTWVPMDTYSWEFYYFLERPGGIWTITRSFVPPPSPQTRPTSIHPEWSRQILNLPLVPIGGN
jgi:hypothetical protein